MVQLKIMGTLVKERKIDLLDVILHVWHLERRENTGKE